MNLVRWDPFKELEEMSDRLNRMFSRHLPRREGSKENLTVPDWAPSVDIVETPEEYLIKADLPDIKREEVKVTVENGVLCFEGERKQEKEEKGRKFHRIERSYGAFMRSFTLPDNIDETKVRADFKDGMLTIHVAKTEKAKPKAVEVKVS
jgi:HSP20 family protein